MILVVLGTQDKPFTRLLKAVENAKIVGLIQDEVIVQSGLSDYQSDVMQVFDLIPFDEFDALMDQADLIITHGGVGTILNALKKHKKIIACPRLAKYGEHGNDHQLQLCEEFEKKGYIKVCQQFEKLHHVINDMKDFEPNEYESTTVQVVERIRKFMNETR